MLLNLLTHAKKECTHQLALPWGTRYLISPELAGTDAIIILLLAMTYRSCQQVLASILWHAGSSLNEIQNDICSLFEWYNAVQCIMR